MKTRAIVDINWGDEGKGRMVDLLTENLLFEIERKTEGADKVNWP